METVHAIYFVATLTVSYVLYARVTTVRGVFYRSLPLSLLLCCLFFLYDYIDIGYLDKFFLIAFPVLFLITLVISMGVGMINLYVRKFSGSKSNR